MQELYATASRTLTIEVLMPLEDDLTGVIRGLLNTPEACMPSRDAVLDNVSQARDELGLAIEKRVERGANREFNKCLRNCRRYLEDALQDWGG